MFLGSDQSDLQLTVAPGRPGLRAHLQIRLQSTFDFLSIHLQWPSQQATHEGPTIGWALLLTNGTSSAGHDDGQQTVLKHGRRAGPSARVRLLQVRKAGGALRRYVV